MASTITAAWNKAWRKLASTDDAHRKKKKERKICIEVESWINYYILYSTDRGSDTFDIIIISIAA